MPVAWRILKEKHAASAFTGEGAAKVGGRWNPRGVPVVYASGSQALAALELLVHLDPPIRFRYVAFRLDFDDTLVEVFPASALPANWRSQPPPPSTQMIGGKWVREKRSAILALPSVIISNEPNYLLNPAHPEFGRIRVDKPEIFSFDPRLID